MIRDPKYRLLSRSSPEAVYQSVTAAEAGWKYLSFMARRMIKDEKWEGNTGENEYMFVVLGGNFSARTSSGSWFAENARKDVFSGLPHALYLPPQTSFEIFAAGGALDIACGWCPGKEGYRPAFVMPEDVVKMGIEHRGGDNASRQINSIFPPGSACHRLVCVEVYTPSGNWSSFPAHKHDTRKVDTSTGKILEAELEEIYFYKVDKPGGFALQKIYNDSRTLDEIAEAHNNDLVMVPEGYHPVVAAHGYNVYYLNFLAGSDQSLASTNDPDHEWIYGTWKGLDPRVPMVNIGMNKKSDNLK